MVVTTCNPSTREVEAQKAPKYKVILGYIGCLMLAWTT